MSWLDRIARALRIHMRAVAAGTPTGVAATANDLHETLADFNALAHLTGRVDYAELARAKTKAARKRAATPEVPNVPFDKAIRALERRAPTVAKDAAAVRSLYAQGGDHFALTRSASETVTRRVRDTMTGLMRDGVTSEDVAAKAIAQLDDGFDEAYARNVWRTNLTTATSAGRMDEAQRQGDRFPALEYMTAGDRDVRPNHRAMDSFIAAVEWWAENPHLQPPLGFL